MRFYLAVTASRNQLPFPITLPISCRFKSVLPPDPLYSLLNFNLSDPLRHRRLLLFLLPQYSQNLLRHLLQQFHLLTRQGSYNLHAVMQKFAYQCLELRHAFFTERNLHHSLVFLGTCTDHQTILLHPADNPGSRVEGHMDIIGNFRHIHCFPPEKQPEDQHLILGTVEKHVLPQIRGYQFFYLFYIIYGKLRKFLGNSVFLQIHGSSCPVTPAYHIV